MKIAKFKESHLENIARALVEGVTHREVTTLLQECAIDAQGGSPRWERLLLAWRGRQDRDGCANGVAAFLQAALQPARFTDCPERYRELRERLNRLLAFDGLHVNDRGRLVAVTAATTLTEAEARATALKQGLLARRVHPDVLRFCRAEFVQDNYFHAVLEATKSIGDKIRSRTNLDCDGTELIDRALAGQRPPLALNSLQTETERGEQRGFVNLLKGVLGTFRNPTAHAPKICWPITELDALDLLTIVSYVHRRLDAAVQTGWR